MADGTEKNIEDIREGDQVWTHARNVKPVTHVMNRAYSGDMITLEVKGYPFPLRMTADHRVAVLRGTKTYPWIDWARADTIQADDRVLVGNLLASTERQTIDLAPLLGDQVVILDELMEEGKSSAISGVEWKGRIKLKRSHSENAILRHLPICPSLGRLLGLYLAEGGVHEGRVTFTFGGDEKNLAAEVLALVLAAEVLALVRGLFGVDGGIERPETRKTVIRARFNNATLATAFKAMVPGDVYTKRIPGFLISATEDVREAVIHGWLDGDGCPRSWYHRSAQMIGVTVSAGLARRYDNSGIVLRHESHLQSPTCL